MDHKPLNDKLNRFSSQILPPSSSLSEHKYPERYKKLADSVGGGLVNGGSGCYCLVKTVYPTDRAHGEYVVASERANAPLPMAAFWADQNSECFSSDQLIFLDTETTGLGGAGAVAFLVGLGQFTKSGFEIRQYLIPDYSDEAAMLKDLHEALSHDQILVSFNGASFDLPLLRDRMIINRVSRKLEFERHLDLLHSARRLFRRRLADCTLANLERELFTFHRSDDIPGYLVPSVYFEWLGSQDLARMNTVLEHNRLDILSLFYLTHLIAEAYQTQGGSLSHGQDLYSLSRYFERRKEIDKVESIFYRVKKELTGLSADAALHYAKNLKRIQKSSVSVEIWESLAREKSIAGFRACVELAKYFEHDQKNFGCALKYADLAGDCKELSAQHKQELQKRAIRLNRKLNSKNDN